MLYCIMNHTSHKHHTYFFGVIRNVGKEKKSIFQEIMNILFVLLHALPSRIT